MKCPKCGGKTESVNGGAYQCEECGFKFNIASESDSPPLKQPNEASVGGKAAENRGDSQPKTTRDSAKAKELELEQLRARLSALEATSTKKKVKSEKASQLKKKFAAFLEPVFGFFKKFGLKIVLPATLGVITLLTLLICLVGVRGVYVSAEDPNTYYEFTATRFTYGSDVGESAMEIDGSWKVSGGIIKLTVKDPLFGKMTDAVEFSRNGYKQIFIDGEELNRVSLVGIKTAAKIKVELDLRGGSADSFASSYKLKLGGLISEPKNLTKEGYSFTGWYGSPFGYFDGETAFNFNNRVWQSQTIYANWRSDAQYTVTGVFENFQVSPNYKLLPILQDKERGIGGGYQYKMSGDSAWIDVDANTRVPAGNFEIRRINEYNKTYTVNFNANGGTVSPSSSKVQFNTAFTLPVPVKAGYMFNGWYSGLINFDEPSGRLTDGDGIGFEPSKFDSNSTVYAGWGLLGNYSLTVGKNLSGASVSGGGTVYSGDSVTVTTSMSGEGYTFLGWFEDGTKLSENISYTFKMPALDVDLEARWAEFSLTLTKNGVGSSTVSGPSGRITAGTSCTVTAAIEGSGYTFLGWFDGDTKLSESLSYTFDMPAKNLTLQARWAEFSLTLSSDNEEAGTVGGSSGRISAGTSCTVTASLISADYKFVGWYDGGTKVSESLSYTFNMPAKNLTLQARWHKKDAFYISTAQQLMGDWEYSGYIYLANDINLNGATWTPRNAGGIFDGCGYTVSNFTIAHQISGNPPYGNNQNVGFFVYSYGTIKNFNLANFEIQGIEEEKDHMDSSYIGGLAVFNEGTIINCRVSGTITSFASGYNNFYGGGLIACNSGNVIDCYADVDIDANCLAGGLIASSPGYGGDIEVENCGAVGNITGKKAGGLIGDCGPYGNVKVTNCYATGNVTGKAYTYNDGIGAGYTVIGNAGGLIGSCGSTTVTNCYATGNVTGGSVGGLIASCGSTTVTNCYSTGNVTGKAYTNDYGDTVRGNAGGLIGDGGEVEVTHCYTTGSVTAEGYAGGLIGYGGEVEVTHCYATGSVTSHGVVPGSHSTGENADAAGLISIVENGNITGCFATGDITAVCDEATEGPVTAAAGGLFTDTGDAVITDCYRSSSQVFLRKEDAAEYSTATNGDGTTTPLGNLQSESFLTGTLGFGNYVSELDLAENPQNVWTFASGQFPKLYWQA